MLGLIALGWLTLPLLALLGFVAVCGTVVYSVAAPSLVPSLVAPAMLPAANARIELARTVAFAAGPALGGLLVGWIGAGPAFGFRGGAVGDRGRAAGRHARAGAAAAAAAIRCRRSARARRSSSAIALLRPVFVTQFIFNTAWFVILAVFVPYAVHHLGLSAARRRHDAGDVRRRHGGRRAVGHPRHARLPFGIVIGLGPVTGFVASAIIALTTVFPTPLLAGLGFFLLGAGPILWVISTTTLRQSVTPPRLLGRVSAINILAYGARPLGAGAGRAGRRPVGRRGLPVSGGRGLRRADAGHPDVTGGEPGAPARDGLRLSYPAFRNLGRRGREVGESPEIQLVSVFGFPRRWEVVGTT